MTGEASGAVKGATGVSIAETGNMGAGCRTGFAGAAAVAASSVTVFTGLAGACTAGVLLLAATGTAVTG
jgi:hypothetical protein